MAISFNDIPNTIRVPLAYIEFDNSGALTGTAAVPYKLLVLGQQNADATAPALTPVRITSADVYKRQGLAGGIARAVACQLVPGVFLRDAGFCGVADITERGRRGDVEIRRIGLAPFVGLVHGHFPLDGDDIPGLHHICGDAVMEKKISFLHGPAFLQRRRDDARKFKRLERPRRVRFKRGQRDHPIDRRPEVRGLRSRVSRAHAGDELSLIHI